MSSKVYANIIFKIGWIGFENPDINFDIKVAAMLSSLIDEFFSFPKGNHNEVLRNSVRDFQGACPRLSNS